MHERTEYESERFDENWKRHMCSVSSSVQSPLIFPSISNSSSISFVQSSTDSFLKDGRKIQVGDCALFQAGNAPPFIGIIKWFTTSKEEDCLKLCVNWLYRPSDIKLAKGILLEAAPNELFYSFHKDVISAASLLHPCRVSFLRKGVELPPGISSFVCRRVYDVANKCFWWLTDQDYINERQEEVDQLLDKTRQEMHASVQSGGRSPKPLNGPTTIQQQKSGTETVQKSKKRERGGDQGTEPIKRERLTKLDDGESTSSKVENMIKSEFTKITEKGSLVTPEGVDKLVHLMQLDKNERKIDLAGRILLVDVIAATDRIECLVRFVQLRGVPVLDDWLQEAHKGKTGDGSSPKENDKSTEDLLLALLRALDKLPVNLNALQTCNIGKSVNHLRSHKNPEIQKKARSLVDTWKKRVDAEMTMLNDGKSGFSEAPHTGTRHIKTSITQTSSTACKTLTSKPGHLDAIVKSTPITAGSLKLPASSPASVSINLKDSPVKGTASSGNSELALASVKDDKSTGSSQSQNNSQSSLKEDAKSYKTAVSSSRHRKSSNGFSGSNPKDGNMGKTSKVSSQSLDSLDHSNSHRLIVRLPARNAHGGSVEDPSVPANRTLSSPDKFDHSDQKIKKNGNRLRSHTAADVIIESCQNSDLAGIHDEESRSADDTGKAPCSSLGNGKGVPLTESKPGNLFSSMNALVESCAKYSEASTSLSTGDNIGINLLANVAAGEISTPSASPKASPRSSPNEESSAADNEDRSKLSCENGAAQNRGHSDENADNDLSKQVTNGKLQDPSKHFSADNVNSCNTTEHSVKPEENFDEERTDKCMPVCAPADTKEGLEGDGANQLAADDKKQISQSSEKIAEDENQAEAALWKDNNTSEITDARKINKCDELQDNHLDSSDDAIEKQNGLASSSTKQADGTLERKEAIDDRPLSDSHKPPLTVPTQKSEKCAQPIATQRKEEVKSSKSDPGAKLDFDLNEGFADDANQSELVSSVAPVSTPAIPLPGISPFIASISNGPHTHNITVASPAKGPFMPPENLLRSKGEPGWKGSAATSAFRPAEPRKILEMSLNTSSSDVEKQGRSPLNIDLNVADEMVLEEEDVVSESSPQTAGSESGVITKSAGGLDLDLNRADESTDTGQFLVSTGSRLEVPLMRAKSSVSRNFPTNESNMLRNFDLNDGPGLDEVGTEMTVQKNQHAKKSNMAFIPQVGGLRMGNCDIGNISSWFPHGNSYPAVAIPSFLPTDSRGGEQQQQSFPIVAAPGTQRILGSVTGPNAFGGDTYRGPVLPSSPAMPFPPPTSFPYASFPFGSTFPLTSASFSSSPTPPYVDSSCFQAIPSQLVGSAGAVSSHYGRPYMVSLPDGSTSSGSERNRKWGGGQGLDLNAGPGSAAPDIDVKDDRRPRQQLPFGSSQAFVEEQARMYQMSGGVMKRKDHEGGSWDERYYKQPSWQ